MTEVQGLFYRKEFLSGPGSVAHVALLFIITFLSRERKHLFLQGDIERGGNVMSS